MNKTYYSVDQIAQALGMHPKTIQRYIREGRLRAAKIGKSWRVTGHDLHRFTEENSKNPSAQADPAVRERVKASAVIDLTVNDPEDAERMMRHLGAAMHSRPPEYGQASMTSQYLEAERAVRLTLWGNLAFLSAAIGLVDTYLDTLEEKEP